MYRDGPGETCFQNSLIRFRAGAEVLPEFALVVFRHYLHAGEFTRVARASTNIAHLSKSRFAEMPLLRSCGRSNPRRSAGIGRVSGVFRH
jgi:type I restriction enzyme, S subunit